MAHMEIISTQTVYKRLCVQHSSVLSKQRNVVCSAFFSSYSKQRKGQFWAHFQLLFSLP